MIGIIKAITGPMFSGKTTQLLKERFKYNEGSFEIFKPTIDDRFGVDSVTTHDGDYSAARNVRFAREIVPTAGVRAVLIDEAQFFDSYIVDKVEELRANQYWVYVAGLSLDWRGKPFGYMHHVLAVADLVCKLRATCYECALPATRTKRLTAGGDVVMVGGGDMYQPVCLKCHRKGIIE